MVVVDAVSVRLGGVVGDDTTGDSRQPVLLGALQDYVWVERAEAAVRRAVRLVLLVPGQSDGNPDVAGLAAEHYLPVGSPSGQRAESERWWSA